MSSSQDDTTPLTAPVDPTVDAPPPPPPAAPSARSNGGNRKGRPLPVHVHIEPSSSQQQQQQQRPPLTVYAVLDGSTILAMHRSVKAASVDAWTRALSNGGASYKIEGWQVAFGDAVETLRVAGWTLDVDDALAWKRAPGKAEWIKEISETNRVPKALWGTFMTQY